MATRAASAESFFHAHREADLLADLRLHVPAGPLQGGRDELRADIAVAAAHGRRYLLTWNCAHIANATMRPKIDAICRANGFEPPIICAPLELVEE